MKGNLMVRMMAVMVLLGLVLAHIFEQADLLSPTWLWISVFAAFMGLQATFTGFCPSNLVGKLSKSGECCPSGSCSSQEPRQTTETKAKATGCCGSDSDTPKAAENQYSCCGSNADGTTSTCGGGAPAESAKSDAEKGAALTIKVLGTGCANCKNTVKLIETTAAEMGVNVMVEKVEEVAEIAAYGVMSTPGVVINEQVVHSGGIPSKQSIAEWLKA